MDCLVSIVVPVYNAQKYLQPCIESIISQSYPNIEILLVDDGSNDDSGMLCDQYAEKDYRIKVFHLHNGGVSAARNYGIIHAAGEYLAFVDSDDVLIPTFIGNAVDNMRKSSADMVIGAFQILSNDEAQSTVDYLRDFSDSCIVTEYLKKMLQFHTEAFWGSNWAKLYRKDIIEKNRLQFETEVQLAEDFRFNISYLHYVKKISILHTPCYLYRVDTENSLSKKTRNVNQYWNEYYVLFTRYKQLYEYWGLYHENEGLVNAFLVRACMTVLRDEMLHGVSHYPSAQRVAADMRSCHEIVDIRARSKGLAPSIRRKLDFLCGYWLNAYLLFLWLLGVRIKIKGKISRRK